MLFNGTLELHSLNSQRYHSCFYKPPCGRERSCHLLFLLFFSLSLSLAGQFLKFQAEEWVVLEECWRARSYLTRHRWNMALCSLSWVDVSSFFLVSGQFHCSPGDSPLQRPLIFPSLISHSQFLPGLLGYDLHLQLLSVEIFGFSQMHLNIRDPGDPRSTLCPTCSMSESTHIFLPAANKDQRLIPAQIPCFFCLWPLSFLRDEPNINPLCAPLVKGTSKAGVIEASLLTLGTRNAALPPLPSSSKRAYSVRHPGGDSAQHRATSVCK